MDTRPTTPALVSRARSGLTRLLALPLLALLALGALAALAACGTATAARPAAPVATTTHLTFDIMPVKPGGPAQQWPAYIATSPTVLPANSVVTVTIRNFDLGDDSLPAGSPMLRVRGTTDGAATMDGKAYASLDAQHIAHTFTIPQLDLNVPISGDAAGDADNVTVTFSFRTPQKPGTYTFQCYVPCGTGTSGFEGPMAMSGYMQGTLTVAA